MARTELWFWFCSAPLTGLESVLGEDTLFLFGAISVLLPPRSCPCLSGNGMS